jgi:predicted MFS family arabinose efflux permease
MGLAASLIFPMSVTAAARNPGRTPAHNIASLSLICFSGYVIGPPVVGALANAAGLRVALLCLLPLAIGIIILAGRAKPSPANIASNTQAERGPLLQRKAV